jgi:hypothetical protein
MRYRCQPVEYRETTVRVSLAVPDKTSAVKGGRSILVGRRRIRCQVGNKHGVRSFVLSTLGPIPWIMAQRLNLVSGSEETGHCSTGLQLASGLNSFIAVAISVVVFPKSFWSRTPSWLMMKVITPELPYSAG